MGCGKWGTVLAAALVLACKSRPVPPATPDEVHQMAMASNAFGFGLYQRLSNTPGNFIFSPYGASECLAMASEGASGDTLQEFRSVLGCPLPQQRLGPAYATLDRQLVLKTGWPKESIPSTFRSANGLWVDRAFPLKRSFLKNVEAFQAGVENLELKRDESAGRINRWASMQTDGCIPAIVDRIDPGACALLVNAVTFKGGWENPFSENLTKPGSFTLLDGSSTQVPMMHTMAGFECARTEGCQALRMPFLEGPFDLLVLLPERNEFQAFEKAMTAERLERIASELFKTHGRFRVEVTVPRFHFENDHDLKGLLQTMGLRTPFTARADFSGLSAAGPLGISGVRQKAMVKLDEKGAEAAAATSTSITLGEDTPDELPPLIEFKADHPFLFLIRDITSGTVLFLGRYVSPQA